jgi:DNA topoisomerase II
VEVDQENNTLSVWNNGRGIPVAVHKEHGCYVPELIFGNLLTGAGGRESLFSSPWMVVVIVVIMVVA